MPDLNDALRSGGSEDIRAALAQREADRAKLHQEIADQDRQMIHGVFLLAFCMIGSYNAATITQKVELYKLVCALAVTTTFWIARGDYMIHRAAAYVRTIETKYAGGWEEAKGKLHSVKLMFFVDIFAALGLLWMLYDCREKMAALGAAGFANICIAGVVLGIAFTGLMVSLAQKRW